MKEYILIVNGIKVEEERFRELHDDFMKARNKNDGCDEESELFRLHEDVYGLGGYWIGYINKPNGLIIGCLMDSFNSYEEINMEQLKNNLEFDNNYHTSYKEYEKWTNEFLGTEDLEFKMHILIEKH